MINSIKDNLIGLSTAMERPVKRIASDVSNIMKDPLESEGIFYMHDEENIHIGRALIIGPSDSLYSHGFYLFKIIFPPDYPVSPPKVIYCTNDGTTRFNPNFYRDGKVCLSMLNTWKGEGWTSCLTLRAILTILQSVLTDVPILNEPGITVASTDYAPYHEIIKYKNFDYAILTLLQKGKLMPEFRIFRETMVTQFLIRYPDIFRVITQNQKGFKKACGKNKANVTTHLYSMNVAIDYPDLVKNVMMARLQYTEECTIPEPTNTIIESK
jgi:ubiquitin-conjugating enzyme E2 Z